MAQHSLLVTINGFEYIHMCEMHKTILKIKYYNIQWLESHGSAPYISVYLLWRDHSGGTHEKEKWVASRFFFLLSFFMCAKLPFLQYIKHWSGRVCLKSQLIGVKRFDDGAQTYRLQTEKERARAHQLPPDTMWTTTTRKELRKPNRTVPGKMRRECALPNYESSKTQLFDYLHRSTEQQRKFKPIQRHTHIYAYAWACLTKGLELVRGI